MWGRRNAEIMKTSNIQPAYAQKLRLGRHSNAKGEDICLSVRQPWAWLVWHGFKGIENREWMHPPKYRGRLLIHAGKTMTRADYEACVIFCQGLPGWVKWRLPSFETLKNWCGGIGGEVNLTECVTESEDPWFCGPLGLVFKDAKLLPFRKCNGALGFFRL